MNTFEILKASRQVRVGGEEISIRELSWMELKTLTEKLAGEAQRILGAMKGKEDASEGAVLLLNGEMFLSIIRDSEELSETLVLQTTGKDEAWLAALSCGEFMGVLDQALDLNLSIVSNSVKKIGGRLREIFAGKAAEPTSATSAK